MSLHDTDAYIVETGTVAESLPDPTTVNGRTHLLENTGTGTVVWSSVGATPFQQGGVNVATISLARGQAIQVQSDGTRWIAKSSGMRAFSAATAVTDGAGNAVFAFPAGLFAVAPIVTATPQAASSNSPIDVRVTAISATSCTINVRQAAVINVALIGLSVLVGTTVAAGITVHLIATPAGSTP
ncbi:hypothetical protein ACFY0G_02305 [Streptomyces sp. NPDC001552]|uniref:hypothetical protein n=1 Tax=Streptomyces sp. NPDC001552 TaxID=3364587 RepID=UPI0036D1DE2C